MSRLVLVVLIAACGSTSTPVPAPVIAPPDAAPVAVPDAAPRGETFELRMYEERTTAGGVRVRYDGQEHKHGKRRTTGTNFFLVASGEAIEKVEIESDDDVTERELHGHLVAIFVRQDGAALVTVRQGPAPAPLEPIAAMRALCDEAVERGFPDCDKGTRAVDPEGATGRYRMKNSGLPELADHRTPPGAVVVQTWHDQRAWRGCMGLHTRTIYEIVESSP